MVLFKEQATQWTVTKRPETHTHNMIKIGFCPLNVKIMDCSTEGARTSIENNELRSQAPTVKKKKKEKETDMRIKSVNESKLLYVLRSLKETHKNSGIRIPSYKCYFNKLEMGYQNPNF